MTQLSILNARLAILIMVALITGCSTTSSIVPQKTSYTLPDTRETNLARTYKKQIDSNKGLSGFEALGSGLEAFALRKALIDKAEKSIDVQYFQVRDDLTGNGFYQTLQEAADRGVRVRVLLDDHYVIDVDGLTAKLAAYDQHPNISVRIFNPYSRRYPRFLQYAFKLGKITRRMHNKSFTVDNTFTILGSRNIGNEYSEAQSEGLDSVFSGMEVLAIGPVVKDISASFDRYWNFPKTVKVTRLSNPGQYSPQLEVKRLGKGRKAEVFFNSLRKSQLAKQVEDGSLTFHWAKATLIADEPTKIIQPRNRQGRYLNATGFQPFIANTSKEALILTPYFIPGKEGIRFFKQLRDRGVKVRILTNSYSSTDIGLVNSHYNKYRIALLKMGVELYEYKSTISDVNLLSRIQRMIKEVATPSVKAGLHAKLISFDQRDVYIGSLNLDPRSLYENTEIGVMISSPNIPKGLYKWFEGNLISQTYQLKLKNGRIIWEDFSKPRKTFTVEPETTLADRFLMNLVRILPIESQL